jgi:hypothetical protein
MKWFFSFLVLLLLVVACSIYASVFFPTLTLPDGFKICRTLTGNKIISPSGEILFKSSDKLEFFLQKDWLLAATCDPSFDKTKKLYKEFVFVNRTTDQKYLFSDSKDFQYILNENLLDGFPNASMMSLELYRDGLISSPVWTQGDRGIFRRSN